MGIALLQGPRSALFLVSKTAPGGTPVLAPSARHVEAPSASSSCHFRANMAHIRQSRPDSGLDLSHFQAKVFIFFKYSPLRSAAVCKLTDISISSGKQQVDDFVGGVTF